jgi:hypothetical protein
MKIDIVGTYRLISAKQTVTATGEVVDYAKEPFGFITYGADGRMMTIMGDHAELRSGSKPLDESDKARIYTAMGAYGGTYAFDGEEIIHYIDVATRPALMGTTLARHVEPRGNRLHYTSTGLPSPKTGVVVNMDVIWEKVPDGYLGAEISK